MDKSLWSLNGYPCLDPVTLYDQLTDQGLPTPFWGKANSFVQTRDLYPSHGWVLVPGGHLNAFLDNGTTPLSQPIHTLTWTDGTNEHTAKNLTIVSTLALGSTRGDWVGYQPTTPYLVELADLRYFARDTALTGDWNYRNAEGELETEDGTWQECLQAIWYSSLSAVLGTLHFEDDIDFPAFGPENLRFRGDNPWNKFISIIQYIGLRLCPLKEFEWVIVGPTNDLTAKATTELGYALNNKLLNTDGVDTFSLPETVLVLCQSRDYQWQLRQCQDKTPADYWKRFPIRFIPFASSDIIPPDQIPYIIPGTTHQLWSNLPYLSDEDGNQVSGDQLYNHCQSMAANYLASQHGTNARRYQHEFTGYPARPSVALDAGQDPDTAIWSDSAFTTRYWSAVSMYDLGDGPKTRVLITPANFNPTNYDQASTEFHLSEEEWAMAPDVQRAHHPHYRFAFAYIAPYTDPQTQVIYNELPPRQHTTGVLLAARVSSGTMVWDPVCEIPEIWNPFEVSIPLDTFNRIEYNYQPDGRGVWQISNSTSGGGGNGPDVGGACVVSNYYVQNTDTVLDQPSLITFNRHSALRVGRRSQDPTPAGEAIVEIAPGPFHTILGTDIDNVPKYEYEPRIWGSVMIGGWYRFSDGTLNPDSTTCDGIGPPRPSGSVCRVRLPDNKWNAQGFGSGYYPLSFEPPYSPYTGTTLQVKSCNFNGVVETEWGPPGLNWDLPVISGATYLAGNWVFTYYTLHFRRGILAGYSQGISTGNYQTAAYTLHNTDAVDDDDKMRDPYEFCYQNQYPDIYPFNAAWKTPGYSGAEQNPEQPIDDGQPVDDGNNLGNEEGGAVGV